MLTPRAYTPRPSRFRPTVAPPNTPRPVVPPEPKVRVVARVRPFLPSERDDAHTELKPCVSILDGSNAETLQILDLKTSHRESYVLDHCYGGEDHVNAIFSAEVEPFLPSLFKGCNATVFAYGATGSGKTYTMQGLEDQPGLMPLALESILAMASKSNACVFVSYYEVYMDRCYDLLEDKAAEISVLEGCDGKVQLRGLSQVQVTTVDEFREVFQYGCLRRKVGRTGINDASSRSHGVLMVTVVSEEGAPAMGKLNLIDLAGNEDNRRSGNEGVRLAESARINQSLFVLSNVINALNAKEIRVPYRDSKLTRILQDSLGGTSRALMIACLSPSSYREAAHTLSLAARSRQIVNQPAHPDKLGNCQEKVDMEAKLQAWLEAKGKVLTRYAASPSPSKARDVCPPPLSLTPVQHVRRNLATPKARKGLLDPTQTSPKKQDDDNRKGLHSGEPANAANSTVDHGLALEMESEKKILASQCEKEKAVFKEVSLHELEVDKENISQDLVSFTPCDKLISYKSLSPPLSERLRNMTAAMRGLLNYNSNVNCNSLVKSPSPQKKDTEISSVLFPNLTTPKTLFHEEGMPTSGTPFEKFSKNSSGIKISLMKEYLDFLNKASREELLELKGIGERRAAYILSLRETSAEPLKELEDLKQIGLSQKQIQCIFNNTARQIFS